MPEVVGHVVAAEGKHGERVAADHADLADVGGGGLGAGRGTHEDAVFPAERLVDERDGAGAAAAEEDGADGHAVGVFPVGVDDGALAGRGCEAGVGMGAGGAAGLGPLVAVPVDALLGRGDAHALPPDVAVGGEDAVGEDGVLLAGVQGVGVGVHRGAGGHAKETGLGVDGVEAAVVADAHPGDVVTDAAHLPARQGGHHHRQVGLAAGGGEGGGDVVGLSLGRGEAEDEHVLGHPTLVARLHRGDAQGQALLAEQGVAAVTRAVGPDDALFGEVGDVFLLDGRAGPLATVALAVGERFADRVQAGDERAGFAELLQDRGAHARHDAHVDDDVGRVGDLDADFGDGRAERTHGEGDDVERAALHAAVVELGHRLLQLGGRDPVVGGAGVLLFFGGDEGALLDARHVAGVGAEEVAAGLFVGVERGGQAAVDHLLAEGVVFSLRAVAPVDVGRLAEGGDLVDPGVQLRVLRGTRHVV